jgi:hypothetical protein
MEEVSKWNNNIILIQISSKSFILTASLIGQAIRIWKERQAYSSSQG